MMLLLAQQGLMQNPELVGDFNPLSLFKNGELGVILDPHTELSLFTDVAGTTAIINPAELIARMNDLSGNNFHATRTDSAQRPAMTLLLTSRRRGVDYSAGDSMNVPLPNMGSNCTFGRARPGIGGVVLTNQTFTGPVNEATDHCGEVIVNRNLTAKETPGLTLWLKRRAGMDDEYNLVYGADTANEVLDVYHSGGNPKRPIMFMVHGGGWRNGDKLMENVVKNKTQHYLPRGFTFVSVNYKLDVGTDPLNQCHSVAKALAYVQANAVLWGCSARNIIVMGHSAGAHLVNLMTAAKATYQVPNGVKPWAGTIILDSAAYDLTEIMDRPHNALYDDPWGTDPAHWEAGSPTLVLDNCPTPMLLVTSTITNPDDQDRNVGPFADLVNNTWGGYAEIMNTDLDHSDTNSLLGVLGPYTTDIDDFIVTKLKIPV